MNYKRRSKKKSSLLRKPKVLIPSLIAAFLLLLAGLELTNTVDLINTKQAGAPDTGNVSPQPTTDKTSRTSASQPSNLPKESPKKSDSQSSYLKSPDQSTYVNTHSASLNSTLQSVCVTSPGATCVIQFTKGGTTESLQAGVADSSGSVIWTWKPSDIDLTTGTWTITAKASLNGQTKTSQDAIKLQIS